MMFKKLAYTLGIGLVAVSMAAFADDKVGTPAEAQAMSEKAATLVNEKGNDAFATFKAEGEYQVKDLYVFCMDMEGKMLLHPKKPELENTNMKDFDKYGEKLFVKMIEVATNPGNGWVDYQWPHPETQELKAKKSYVIKNDKGFFCGVGAYAP